MDGAPRTTGPFDDVTDTLARLVAFDTTSATSNLDLVGWVADGLDATGWSCTVLPCEEGDRANLVAVLGPQEPGGLVLSAHTDCVPVTGQPWTSDPFTMVERDGRLVGRGTTDMKGFLAACLHGLADVQAGSLRRPLVLALSYDEELGTVGAPALVDAVRDLVPSPSLAVIGEPTQLCVVDAHKGVRTWEVEVTGRDGHSSQPARGASAIAAAARLITFAEGLGAPDAPGPRDEAFDPPFTSVNVGSVSGGQAINIIPRSCRFMLEYRPVPSDALDRVHDEVRRHADEVVLPALRARAPEASVTMRPGTHVVPLARQDPNPAADAARAAGASPDPASTAPYGTDAGHFQAAGIPAVVCGPGSIEQAHRPDEWLASEQLLQAVELVRGLARQAT